MPGFLSGVEEGMGGGDKGKDKIKKAIGAVVGKITGKKGTSGSKSGEAATDDTQQGQMVGGWTSAKKGGTVKKTGNIKLHRGEKVLTAKQAKRYAKRGRGKSY